MSLASPFSTSPVRSYRNSAFALLALSGVIGVSPSAARAQNAAGTQSEALTATKRKVEQLTFTIDGKTCTILADKIIEHKKGTSLGSVNKDFPIVATDTPLYSLKGDFRIVNTDGWVFFGKDAEIVLESDDPVGQAITIYPRNGMRRLRPLKDSEGILRMEEKESVNPGAHVGIIVYLNAKTFRTNSAGQPTLGK